MQANNLFYRYYDSMFAGKDYAGEVQTILALLPNAGSIHRILEIGSGTGGHTFALARLGFEVVGVDIDSQMVAIAKNKYAGIPAEVTKRVQFYNSSVEKLSDADFDLAMAMFNVVNYLPDLSVLRRFMGGVADRIHPGCAFIFDAWNGVAAVLDPPRNENRTIETATHTLHIKIESQTDYMNLSTEMRYNLVVTNKKSGQKEQGTHLIKSTLWPPKVLSDVLQTSGFKIKKVCPVHDPTREANIKDWKILFLCYLN